jgi:hypothetical protein
VKGRTIRPEIKNLVPAKWSGVSYLRPILIAAYAVDHNRQATMARRIMFRLLYNKALFRCKYQKYFHLL